MSSFLLQRETLECRLFATRNRVTAESETILDFERFEQLISPLCEFNLFSNMNGDSWRQLPLSEQLNIFFSQ